MIILVLWAAGLGAAGQFAKIAVPFGSLRALYPEAGWLLSVVSLLGVVFGMSAGVLVARIGGQRLLIASLLLGAAMSLWQAALPSFAVMLASRLIEGFSHLMIVVAAPTLIADIAPQRFRAAAMTLWSTFFGVAFALIAWLGLPLVAAYGLPMLFLAHGLFMVLIVGGLRVGLGSDGQKVSGSGSGLGLSLILRQQITAYRSPRISAPGLGWLFYTLTFVALLALLPDRLPEESRSEAMTLMPLASIAAALLLVTPMLLWLHAVTIVILGFIMAGGVMALFWTGLPTPLLAVLLFAVLGLVQGASFAAVPALNTTTETRALSNAALAQMGNLGNSIGTPLLLRAQAEAGLHGLLIAIIICYSLGAAVHILLAHARRSNQGEGQAAITSQP